MRFVKKTPADSNGLAGFFVCAEFPGGCASEQRGLNDRVAFQPRGGYVLQPRVAAAATLGSVRRNCQPQRGCVICFAVEWVESQLNPPGRPDNVEVARTSAAIILTRIVQLQR